MKAHFDIRCALWRLLLILPPALLCVERASGQYAPVVNADDQSWRAAFQEQNGASPSGPVLQDRGGSVLPQGSGPVAQHGGGFIEKLPANVKGGMWGGGLYPGSEGCQGCGSGECCECTPPPVVCCPPKRKRFDIFGEYLYLRPRNAEVAYAVPIDGPIAPVFGNGIQIGPTAVVDPNHRSGYRVGFNCLGCECGAIGIQWTHYESSAEDAVNTGVPNVIRSLVTHPLGIDAASDGLQANARLDIDFDLIDLAVRTPWMRCRRWHTDIIWGLRYGQLQQNFFSSIDVNGSTDVITEIDFNGMGPQIGLNSIHQIGCGGLHVYGRGDASFMVGKFDANYIQDDAFSDGPVVNSSWESGRIVPELELELGLGWASCQGRCHLRCGYMVDAWFNAVRTNEFINSVQTNNPDELGSGITFDGLVVRAELRF